MIDPITKLAVSMQAKKGAFALLIGSGVSQAAQIPTGWHILLDLIRQVATLHGEASVTEPEAWYREKFNEEPDYSVVFGRLTQTSAERSQILRRYIEPSNEERDLGLKLPTEAHRAIAEIVANGYVRVIITTNFDRLLETALSEVGIAPAVIDSVDAARGTLPLVHNVCTIVKVHGDYLDARIKNLTEELAEYSPEINQLLDQVFREYGLIVCGWSGEWDKALVKALKRRSSPWFPIYWVSYREPRPSVLALAEYCQAELVTNMDADTFFRRIADSVAALEDLARPELISAEVARATIERYIDDPTKRIRLNRLVVGEANRIRRAVEDETTSLHVSQITQEAVSNHLEHYINMTEVLRVLLASGCYWGGEQHEQHWITCLEQVASPARADGPRHDDLMALRRFPALVALYTGGIAAMAGGKFRTLDALLTEATTTDYVSGRRVPLSLVVDASIISERVAKVLMPEVAPWWYVRHLYLWNSQALWKPLREYIVDDNQFAALFDRFEYLLGVVRLDISVEMGIDAWVPLGLFVCRNMGYYAQDFLNEVDREINEQGSDWPPLRAGLFGGSVE